MFQSSVPLTVEFVGDVTSTMGVNVVSITTDGTALHTMLLVRRIVVCDRNNGARVMVGCFFTRRRVLHCEMYRSRKGCTTCAATAFARLSARCFLKHRCITIAALVLAASPASAFFFDVLYFGQFFDLLVFSTHAASRARNVIVHYARTSAAVLKCARCVKTAEKRPALKS